MSPNTCTLFIFLIASTKNIGAIDPYPDAVVSFWRLDAEGRTPEALLGVGAVITPNCIFVLKKFLEILLPLNTVGFCTGRSYRQSRKIENSAIVDALDIPAHKSFIFLVVKPSIYVETTFGITHNYNLPGRVVHDDCGYFIGWNSQDGYRRENVLFDRHHHFFLSVTQEVAITKDDFPASSFLVKGNNIIAVTYFASDIIGAYNFTQVSFDLTSHLRKTLRNIDELRKADGDPFPEAVVSFWRLDEEEQPRELLYVAALIHSKFILVPRNALNILKPFESLGLYTRHKYTAELPTSSKPVRHTIVGEAILETERFIILVMKPGVQLPNPYIVTSPDPCSKRTYDGYFIGWEKTNIAEREATDVVHFQENLHLMFKDKTRNFTHFPLGSFVVTKNGHIKAIFHSIDGDGEPAFLGLSDNDCELIRIFLEIQNNPNPGYMARR